MRSIEIEPVEYFTQMYKGDLKFKLAKAKKSAEKLIESKPLFLTKNTNIFYRFYDRDQSYGFFWLMRPPRSKKIEVFSPVIKKKHLNEVVLKKIVKELERILKEKKATRVDFHSSVFPNNTIKVFQKTGYQITANQFRKDLGRTDKKKETNIIFKKMTYSQYRSFNKYLLDGNEDMVKVMGKTKKEADSTMKSMVKALVPKGFKDKNNYMYNTIDKKSKKKIGTLWLIVMNKNNRKYVFLADIFIFKKYRGQGFGENIMNSIDNFVISKKLKQIQLNVFEYNQVAKNLYLKSGYERIDLGMCKKFK